MKPTSFFRNLHLNSRRLNFPASLIVIPMAFAGLAQGVPLTWDSGNTSNGATIDAAAGTWSTTGGGVWNNGTTNVAWTQTNATTALNSAVFGGADGSYEIAVGEALAASAINFNNSGYTLSATASKVITNGDTLQVATGKSATIGNNVTVQRTGTTVVLVGTAGTATGTLNIAAGGTVQATNTGSHQITGVGTVINVSGTLARTSTTDSSSNLLRVATNIADDVTITVESGGNLNVGGRRLETGYIGKATVNVKTGGTLTMTSSAGGHLYAGFNTGNGTINVTGGTAATGAVGELIVGGGTSVGTLSVSSGSVTANGRMAVAENGTATATLSDTGSISIKSTTTGMNFASGTLATAAGTFNLNGGTLTTPAITKNTAAASATFNFNGGTLKPNKSNAAFMAGLNTANVHDNGAIINTNDFDITIDQALTHSVLSGANATDGGLTKSGGGTLTLGNAANTYTGQTTVNGGTLLLDNKSLTSHAGLAIGASGTFKAKGFVTSAGNLASQGQLNISAAEINTLTVGGGLNLTNSSLTIDLANGSADSINVTGSATLTGTNTIHVNMVPGEALVNGDYTILTSAGGLNAAHFTIGSKPAGFNTFLLSTPTPNALVLRVIAGNAAPATAYWTGSASATGSPSESQNLWGYGAALAVSKSNWSTTANGLTDPLQVPGPGSNVIFTAANASGIAGVLSTKLDVAYAVNGLAFNVPVSTGISSTVIDTNGSALSIADGGLELAATSNSSATINGSGSVNINAFYEVWTNSSDSQSLTVAVPVKSTVAASNALSLNAVGTGGLILSGGVADGVGSPLRLTLDSPGLVTLGGPCSHTGATEVNAGRLLLENTGIFTSALALNSAVPDAVTFHQDSQSLVLPDVPVTGAGGIVKTGPGNLTLSNGLGTYSGGTTVNGGTLLLNSNGGINSAGDAAAGNPSTVGAMSPSNVVTVNNGSTLAINGTAPFGNSNLLPAYAPSLVVNAGGTVTGNAFVAFLPNVTLNGGTITVGAGNTTGGFNTNLGLVGTVTVGGSVPSSITTPVAGGNSRISLGGGAAGNNGVTFVVADVTGNTDADFTISSIVRNAGSSFAPLVSPLVKSGPGTMLLSAVNTYTGATTVQQGELILTNPCLADGADVVIGAAGVLNLNHTSPDTVHALTINGVQLAAGTYGAGGISNPHLTGNGSLVVATGPVLSPYATWATVIPNEADRDLTDDPDGDGFNNLGEYLFGTSPVAQTGTLTTTTRSGSEITLRWFQRATGGTYSLEESSTLLPGSWGPSVTPVLDPESTAPADCTAWKATVTAGTPNKFFRVRGAE